jgi:hypothetical protein
MALSKVVTLTVNGHTIKLSNQIKIFQNDQIYLVFRINEYGISVKGGISDTKKIMPINPLQATLYVETPLGIDSIESASIEDNTVIFHLENKYTQYIGVSKMQIKLTDKDCCQITLPHFEFEVKENIYDERIMYKSVILSDENDNIVVDENNNVLNVGTEIYNKPLTETIPIEEITTIQIQDFDLDNNVTGDEDVLIQDRGITKRVKASKLVEDVMKPELILNEYYTKEDLKFDENTIVPVALGGIKEGTDISNLSVQDVLSKLLFPYIAPILSVSLTKSPNKSICEYGESVTISGISGNVTKKSEKILRVAFLDSDTILTQFTTDIENGGSFTYEFTTPVTISNNLSSSRFRMTVTDNLGNVFYANTNSVNFYYPYYFGVVEENQIITSDSFANFTKKIEAKGTKTNSYTTNNQCMLIAYPKSYGDLKKILDQNSFDVTNTFIRSEINVVGLDKTSQVYYVYVNNASTVTNFKITFQY